MRTGTSTHMNEPTESLTGRPPPCWLGPVAVIDFGSSVDWSQRSSVWQSPSGNAVYEIHITTAELWSKRSSTGWFLPVHGKTTPQSTLSTSPPLYALVGSSLWLFRSYHRDKWSLHVVTDRMGNVSIENVMVERKFGYESYTHVTHNVRFG